tara:strand:- start:399 stop:653 length:255 start_codon:yes stop_codon:yes gene_type:complete
MSHYYEVYSVETQIDGSEETRLMGKADVPKWWNEAFSGRGYNPITELRITTMSDEEKRTEITTVTKKKDRRISHPSQRRAEDRG